MTTVQQAIMDRRSTRGFDGVPMTETELQTLIDAALQSPSAMNKQPWHFAFVRDAAVLDEFRALSKDFLQKNMPEDIRPRFSAPDYDMLMGAPLFVVISVPSKEDGPFTGVDCGIAVENLALSAMGMGLGSVIVGMPCVIFEDEHLGAHFKEKMSVPEGDRFVIGIVIGHNNVSKDAHPVFENKYSIV